MLTPFSQMPMSNPEATKTTHEHSVAVIKLMILKCRDYPGLPEKVQYPPHRSSQKIETGVWGTESQSQRQGAGPEI